MECGRQIRWDQAGKMKRQPPQSPVGVYRAVHRSRENRRLSLSGGQNWRIVPHQNEIAHPDSAFLFAAPRQLPARPAPVWWCGAGLVCETISDQRPRSNWEVIPLDLLAFVPFAPIIRNRHFVD